MADYDTYLTVNLNGVLTLGVQTFTAVSVTDVGAPPDDTSILGDQSPDTFTAPVGLFGADASFTFGGVVYNQDGEPVGFVGTSIGPLGETLYTTFVPTGTDPTSLTLTLLEDDTTVVESQWDLDTAAPVCFMAGTHIATPQGEVRIETLSAGDMVVTSDGKTAPVRWIGICTVVRRFADPMRALPICVRAGALGDESPTRDLFLSPDHAILLGGRLIHAGALVNGASIFRDTSAAETFKYYHIELDDHSLILANGVVAETFVDNVTRMRFDNWEEHVALFGEGLSITEMDLPRAKSARQIPHALRQAILARAASLGAIERHAHAA